MALDVNDIPDGPGTIDFSGNSDAPGGDGGASLADMQALMDGGGAEAPAGDPAAPAPAGDGAPAPAAPAAAAPAPAAEAKPEEPAAEPAPTGPSPEVLAEQARLRKAWADVAKTKEQALKKQNEAAAAVERAKQFEADAIAFRALPEKVKADPLGFLASIMGGDIEEVSNAILDKVVETEKSPVEREIAALKKQLADKEAATAKAQEEAKQQAVKAEQERTIQAWTKSNIEFASSTPENVEKYDLINTFDLGEAVHATCLAYYQQHGVVLPAKDAADHLEKRLRDNAKKSKALSGLFVAASPPAAAPRPATAPAAAPAEQQKAPTSQPNTAPRNQGPSTLAAVGSGDGAPSSTQLSEDPSDGDDRFASVLADLQREGQLPDDWRVRNVS